jgi:PAS domain S-box-containing protein
MKSPIAALRAFLGNLGPVEQAQIVASTAVVVSMATIISAMAATGQSPRLMDFISILTVGLIGFVSVYFSLQYSRQLDEQRRQLMALYNISEAVSKVAELDDVLETALTRISGLLDVSYGWVYLLEGDRLVCAQSRGTAEDFFAIAVPSRTSVSSWLHQPRVERERLADRPARISASGKALGIQCWTSVPLKAKDGPTGIFVLASGNFEMFTPKEAELIEAFSNQISVAISNVALFERLRQSERRYMDLFENAPDMYITVGRDHGILSCNQTGATMLGAKVADVIGRPFDSLFAGPQQESVREAMARMFAEGRGMRDVEAQLVTANGAGLTVNLNASLVRDESGETADARIVARDIVERKQMEAALLHAQKIDSIGNLAGGIAHDFNNILSAVLGSASIMRRKLPARAPLAKYVEIIENSARRGSSLTRQLLTFARKTETIVRTVDINALILETLQLYERSVSKEIVINTELAESAPTVVGDEGQIQQALLNLFLNARDAMPEGGTLSVGTAVTTADARTTSLFTTIKPGRFVQIQVNDTGHGIQRELQNRVFEPFFTTKDHGTGLGLSVVYGVVQNHGGFINFESTVGRGTSFSIYLPHAGAVSRREGRQKRARVPRGTEHILLIEDELSVCEIAQDMLTGLGYTVAAAHDGRQGVDTYRSRQGSIDLVLLDINMPVMGGKEAFEQLRGINPGVRIVIVTGYGHEAVDIGAFPSEVNGFVQKPFQLETLAVTVRTVLDSPVSQRAQAS